jgi:hypothetical protein
MLNFFLNLNSNFKSWIHNGRRNIVTAITNNQYIRTLNRRAPFNESLNRINNSERRSVFGEQKQKIEYRIRSRLFIRSSTSALGGFSLNKNYLIENQSDFYRVLEVLSNKYSPDDKKIYYIYDILDVIENESSLEDIKEKYTIEEIIYVPLDFLKAKITVNFLR